MMKKLPVNISNFRTMIEGNYIYIDKTRTIYDLLSTERLFFLSRPRRFGKSLLISILKELFAGNKQLFADTWIGSKASDYNWQEYPVIHLDFSRLAIETSQEFKKDLIKEIELVAKHYNITLSKSSSVNAVFIDLVTMLSQNSKIVILIDEYDYVLLKNLSKLPIAKSIQEIMSSFFAAIKSLDGAGYIHALFITGVTKFSKTSLFSGMNNLSDLTMDPQAASLLGYTKNEIQQYFAEYLDDFAKEQKITVKALIDEIQMRYNGYRFSRVENKVYNPYSVLLCLSKKYFANYWFESGTPSFLVELLKKQYDEIKNIETVELSSGVLGTFDLEGIHIIPVLLQAGYLTIHGYDEKTRKYLLGYPNAEVKDSFNTYLLVALTYSPAQRVERAVDGFKDALDSNDMELFCTTLESLLASIPYQLHLAKEAYYHSLLHVLITALGLESDSEVGTSRGRIDLVIKTKQRIFIFEFKLQSTGQKALEQIIEKSYYQKYVRLRKPITLIGMAFNIKKKQLVLDWVVQDMQKIKERILKKRTTKNW